MSILGLGTDIVEIERIEKVLTRHSEAFAKRVLTDTEFALFQASSFPARYLAKRFAAKEAAAKALGTGIASGVSFQDFHIDNDEMGKPNLMCSGVAKTLLQQKGVRQIWLSIADEKHYAVATVIFS